MQEIIEQLLLSISSSQEALTLLNTKKQEIAMIGIESLRVSSLADLERASDFLLQSIAKENQMIKRLKNLLEAKGK